MKKITHNNGFLIRMGILTFLGWLFMCGGMELMAQTTDYTRIESEVQRATGSIRTIVQYILYSALFIALIHVVYSVATSNPKMKDIIISWGVALIVLYLGMALIPR